MAINAAISACHCSRLSRKPTSSLPPGEVTCEEQPGSQGHGHSQPDHARAKARVDAGQGHGGKDAADSHPQPGERSQVERQPAGAV